MPIYSRLKRTRIAALLCGVLAIGGGTLLTAQANEPDSPKMPIVSEPERLSPLAAVIKGLVNRIERIEGGLVPQDGPRAEENERLLREIQAEARRAGKKDPLEECVRKLKRGLARVDFLRAAASSTYTRSRFLQIDTGALSPYTDSDEELSQPVDCRLNMEIEFLPNRELEQPKK